MLHLRRPSMVAALVALAFGTPPSLGWSLASPQQRGRKFFSAAPRIAVPAGELDADLTPEERTVVSVVRTGGPSVAYVTSILPRYGRRTFPNNSLPSGRFLGSGSAFLVDSRGYLVTNYHVIENAHQRIAMVEALNSLVDGLVGNLTNSTGLSWDMVQSLRPSPGTMVPEVYVRIDSGTRYQKCRIVDVKPDLDIAVLKILDVANGTTVSYPPLQFGSSASLLVGQSLVAIGNPFGLDNSVSTGVVSALNRELNTLGRTRRTTRVQPLRNCIQTDAAINPGNSGGPLLNLRGQVVGVNTAIVSTSGSNAGIGFAVPSDRIQPFVEKAILNDRAVAIGGVRGRGWLGVSIVQRDGDAFLCHKNWVAQIEADSPAEKAGIRALQISECGSVVYGDAIVAIGGNPVDAFEDLQAELKRCLVGENLAVTVEDAAGERRVVYIQLEARP